MNVKISAISALCFWRICVNWFDALGLVSSENVLLINVNLQPISDSVRGGWTATLTPTTPNYFAQKNDNNLTNVVCLPALFIWVFILLIHTFHQNTSWWNCWFWLWLNCHLNMAPGYVCVCLSLFSFLFLFSSLLLKKYRKTWSLQSTEGIYLFIDSVYKFLM